MIEVLELEVPMRHDPEHMRCICRLRVNGERRGKLSLTKSEALVIASVLAEGAKSKEHLQFNVTLAGAA